MPLLNAVRPYLMWIFPAALAATAVGYALHDDTEYYTCEDEYAMTMEMQPRFEFQAIISDRANRWIADHPNQCPRGDQIASVAELAAINTSKLELVCNGKRVVAMTMNPLVRWPALPSD